ncbi:hypothetical protein GUJ93_ZPchr0005g15293 [Zizania palustris]|uniref:Uncharacterized protein n=1 Tax=Zizania palustris TaxID=103762 RepID=A0A8J5SK39_ZIZPA|nr:hypothetical protein GUJ93_ZPchr0005g15293 [Zizania palustris]
MDGQSMEELKQSLMVMTLELETDKEELEKKEQSIVKLADLVRQVTKERDDVRDQLQQLLAAAIAKPLAPVTSSVTDSDSNLVLSPVDPFFDPITSSDKRCKISSPPPAAKQQCHAMKKPLPQSVMEAGPLLQNLLVAGLLPRWQFSQRAAGRLADGRGDGNYSNVVDGDANTVRALV